MWCQVVANQPHDEEVNLSDGDDSSPEVRSPRPSPAPRPRAFAFAQGVQQPSKRWDGCGVAPAGPPLWSDSHHTPIGTSRRGAHTSQGAPFLLAQASWTKPTRKPRGLGGWACRLSSGKGRDA